MKRKLKILTASVMIMCGVALIAWNMRDPDAAYREQPKVEKVVTTTEVPPPVQATIQRLAAGGGQLGEIQEESRGSMVKYEAEVIRGNTKIKYEISPDGAIVKQKSKKLKQ
jgi:hypothetical protein